MSPEAGKDCQGECEKLSIFLVVLTEMLKIMLEGPGSTDLGLAGGKLKCFKCAQCARCIMSFNPYINSFIYYVILFLHQLFKGVYC